MSSVPRKRNPKSPFAAFESAPSREPPSEGQPELPATSMEFDAAAGTGDAILPMPPLPAKPEFAAIAAQEVEGEVQFRKVSVPPHRYSPLKKNWTDIYTLVYDHMKIDIRMNLKARKVELKSRSDTPDVGSLQKCAEFVQAFMLGFDVADAMSILREEAVFVESFEIHDVRTLRGEHEKRAIGRLAGKQGKTRFAIENISRTRIVIADKKIHLLGRPMNVKMARSALCSLILGSPAAKVRSKLMSLSDRLRESGL